MEGFYSRTIQLIGQDSLDKLKNSKVAVFGVGGVGGFCVEALVRSGVGSITVIDSDVVKLSNFNRQIIADNTTLNLPKVEAVKARALAINPQLKIECVNAFYLPENADDIDLSKYDYIVDAIDTVTAKIEIIKRAKKLNVKIISCMGTGRKTDPTALVVADITKTKNCPLARVIRRELRAIGITELKVVYSTEQAKRVEQSSVKENEKMPPASMIFVPASAGILLAREVVFHLINEK